MITTMRVGRLDKAHRTLREGSVRFDFRARTDAELFELRGEAGRCALRIEDGRLLYAVDAAPSWGLLDAEDTAPLADGGWHSVCVTVEANGTRLYLDGYQVFAGTVNVFCAGLGGKVEVAAGADPRVELRDFRLGGEVPTPWQVVADACRPVPVVEFAAHRLDGFDVEQVAGLAEGTIVLRYRVRGPGQEGTLVAAGRAGEECVRLTVGQDGLCWQVRVTESRWRTFAASGDWVDGRWHDVAVRAARGAVDLYVDGFRVAHLPGRAFLADAGGLDEVVIGQSLAGRRLWGEVQRGGIYASTLNDGQVRLLAGAEPLHTVAVFDRGYDGAASYRIPVLQALPDGTLIAGADRRTTSANDSPNHIEFVVRRSRDGGETWEEPITVIRSVGSGATGASVIDGCIVHDADTGRLFVLIDHFPGGIGQPNNAQGVGLTAEGDWLLYDDRGGVFRTTTDGGVLTLDGESTGYRVAADGAVTADGEPAGNVHLARGEDPGESLSIARTSFLQLVWSDDEGVTWHGPRNLNHLVKQDWMHFLGAAPGSGIQLRHGTRAGRLVIPVYYEGEHLKRVSSAVVYSDDHGESWRLGASPNDGREFDGRSLDSRTLDVEAAALHECAVIERRDGSLLLMMRNQHPAGRVLTSVSQDGGETWGSVELAPELPEIFCQPNAVSLDPGTDTVAFMNASQMLPFRGNGVLRISRDGGRTWPWSRTVNPGHHVYQSMAVLADGDLGLLWENEWQGLYFTRIPARWWSA